MVYKTITTAILVAGLTLGATFSVSAADKPKLMTGASASMLANTCAGCHGTNGVSRDLPLPASPECPLNISLRSWRALPMAKFPPPSWAVSQKVIAKMKSSQWPNSTAKYHLA